VSHSGGGSGNRCEAFRSGAVRGKAMGTVSAQRGTNPRRPFLPKLRTVSFRWYALGARFQELHPGLVAMGHQMRSDLLPRKEDHDGIANTPPFYVIVLFGILIKRLIHLHFVGNWRLLIIPSAPLKLEASPN
jgi:hypothetical protein